MQKNQISSFAHGRHTFHLTGDMSPGWPSTVGWIKISKHVNWGQDDTITWLSSSLFRSMFRYGRNEISRRETFIEGKYCVLIKDCGKSLALWKKPLGTSHSSALELSTLTCLLWLLSLPSHSPTWSVHLKTLCPQIPGQPHCISIDSSLNFRGGRETFLSNFFLLQRRKPLVVLEMWTEVIWKRDFMETHEMWLSTITHRWSIEPGQKLLPPSDRYSGTLNIPSLVTWVPFRAVKELTYDMVCTRMSPCENTALFYHSFRLIFEIDPIHITLTRKANTTL